MSITKEKIDRINELAHKARERALSEAELAERDELRKEYIAAFRENLRAQLDSIEIVDGPAEAEEIEEELDEAVHEALSEAEKDRENE